MNKTEHLLVCLAEECAEVQQSVAKALRFGLDDYYAKEKGTNRHNIAKEYAEIVAIIELLEEFGILDHTWNYEVVEAKKERVRRYMDYAQMVGTLE